MNLPIELISYILEYFVEKNNRITSLLISKNITKYFKQYYNKYLHKYFEINSCKYRSINRKIKRNYKDIEIIITEEVCYDKKNKKYVDIMVIFIKTKEKIYPTSIINSIQDFFDICFKNEILLSEYKNKEGYKFFIEEFQISEKNVMYIFTKNMLKNDEIIFNGIADYDDNGYFINDIANIISVDDWTLVGLDFTVDKHNFESSILDPLYYKCVCKYLKINKKNIEKKYMNIIKENMFKTL